MGISSNFGESTEKSSPSVSLDDERFDLVRFERRERLVQIAEKRGISFEQLEEVLAIMHDVIARRGTGRATLERSRARLGW